jgi:hypothetical protein
VPATSTKLFGEVICLDSDDEAVEVYIYGVEERCFSAKENLYNKISIATADRKLWRNEIYNRRIEGLRTIDDFSLEITLKWVRSRFLMKCRCKLC